ncbi:hypothetical protein EV1_043700 [Malus domestica]
MQPLHSTELRNRRGELRTRRGKLRNHRHFVKAPIPDIEEALAFPDLSAPVTCTLSLAEITGNLSKISCEVEST